MRGPCRQSATVNEIVVKASVPDLSPGPICVPSAIRPWQAAHPRSEKTRSPTRGDPVGSKYRRLARTSASRPSHCPEEPEEKSHFRGLPSIAGAWFHRTLANWPSVSGRSCSGPSSGPRCHPARVRNGTACICAGTRPPKLCIAGYFPCVRRRLGSAETHIRDQIIHLITRELGPCPRVLVIGAIIDPAWLNIVSVQAFESEAAAILDSSGAAWPPVPPTEWQRNATLLVNTAGQR